MTLHHPSYKKPRVIEGKLDVSFETSGRDNRPFLVEIEVFWRECFKKKNYIHKHFLELGWYVHPQIVTIPFKKSIFDEKVNII